DLDGPGAEHVPFALTTAGYGFVNLLLCIVQGLHGSIQGDSKALLEYVLTGVMVLVVTLMCSTLAMTGRPRRVDIGHGVATVLEVGLLLLYASRAWTALGFTKPWVPQVTHLLMAAVSGAALVANLFLRPGGEKAKEM
ncbi:unnamed protein product, partial [Polarella glacialis]